MFRTITRLFFGGEEETPKEVKSGEVLEEGWLVVNHHGQSCSLFSFSKKIINNDVNL